MLVICGLSALSLGTQLTSAQVPWQQQVDYRIEAEIDGHTRRLVGNERVLYRNRSPQALDVLYFRLDLNGSRPGSRWLERQESSGSTVHRDAGPSLGGQWIAGVTVDGVEVDPLWPASPDSTVFRVDLPAPLPPTHDVVVTIDWTAELPAISELEKNRGGFHLDGWYPRAAVFDRRGWQARPRLPPGDAYADFGTYLVTLDVPTDQVMAATGVPLCGDPGWDWTERLDGPAPPPVMDGYPEPGDPVARALRRDPDRCPPSGSNSKTVVWYAENVTHFALSMSPTQRFEQGDIFELPVRLLFNPEDERTWGAGLVTGRVETGLAWLNEIFGPYPWPQITTVQVTGASTRTQPMLDRTVEPGLAAMLHGVGGNYAGGILANDPERETWLGEGLNHFQRTSFYRAQGVRGGYEGLERRVLEWDLDGLSDVVAQPVHDFRDPTTQRAMTRDRAELFFHQLRADLGDDAMARTLRSYFDTYRFRHVDEMALRNVAEAEAGRSLEGLFEAWLRSTELFDVSVSEAHRTQQADGSWTTDVHVSWKTAFPQPVEVWVYAEEDTTVTRTRGSEDVEVVQVTTTTRPRLVGVDPRSRAHDWNALNNQKTFGFRPSILVLQPDRPQYHYADTYFSRKNRRDRIAVGWAPLAWYNDAGGWTFGLRSRSDYLGRFELNTVSLTQSTGWGTEDGRTDFNVWAKISNPVGMRANGQGQSLELAWAEGRAAAGVGWTKNLRRSLADTRDAEVGLSLDWLATNDMAYLDPGYYEDGGTVELTGTANLAGVSDGWRLSLDGALAAGWMYRNDEATSEADRSNQPYGRITAAATARRSLGRPVTVAARVYAGATLSQDPLIRQRDVFLAGAGPYARFRNPFLRSNGSILAADGFHYNEPGGVGLRGLDPRVAASQAYGVSLEFEMDFWAGGTGLFQRGGLAAFVDLAVADGDLDTSGSGGLYGVGDGGVGFRIDHRIGQTEFQTRFDAPLWVSRPELAQDTYPGDQAFGLRWTFSFRPAL